MYQASPVVNVASECQLNSAISSSEILRGGPSKRGGRDGGRSEEDLERMWELSDEFEQLRRNSTIAANCNESQTNVAPVPFGGEYSWEIIVHNLLVK